MKRCQGPGCQAPAAWRWVRSDLGRIALLCATCADAIRAMNVRHGRAADMDLYPLSNERNTRK